MWDWLRLMQNGRAAWWKYSLLGSRCRHRLHNSTQAVLHRHWHGRCVSRHQQIVALPLSSCSVLLHVVLYLMVLHDRASVYVTVSLRFVGKADAVMCSWHVMCHCHHVRAYIMCVLTMSNFLWFHFWFVAYSCAVYRDNYSRGISCLFSSSFHAFATRHCQQRHYVFRLSVLHLSICLDRYLVNGLRNVDETYSEYSLGPTDDLM